MFGFMAALKRLAAAANRLAGHLEDCSDCIESHRTPEPEARTLPAPEPGQPAEANGRPRAKAKAV